MDAGNPSPSTLQVSVVAKWWGLVGEILAKTVGIISKTSEEISGIPGSGVDHSGVLPDSLTEGSVSVYRMNSLVPTTLLSSKRTTGDIHPP